MNRKVMNRKTTTKRMSRKTNRKTINRKLNRRTMSRNRMSKKDQRIFRVVAASLAIMVLSVLVLSMVQKPEKVKAAEVHSVWVCFYEFDKIGLANVDETTFRANARKMYTKMKAKECNTVYFHVRAHDDAIWPSTVFPFSEYMGKTMPDYDPLQILVEEAHRQKISFHAWMNPYRKSSTKVLNPGKASTINRVVAAVREVAEGYDVDGIHFDDYFYPSGKYGNLSVATKKKNVNKMIRKVYKVVKASSPSMQFGISPAGNVEYCHSIGADVERWMKKKGYIDYIVPQIYWSDNYKMGGKKVKLYTKRLKQWKSLNKKKIPMYIGLGLYRAQMRDSQDLGWRQRNNNLVSQVKLLRNQKMNGYSLFSYTSMFGKKQKTEMNNLLSYIRNQKAPKTETADTETPKVETAEVTATGASVERS